MESLLQKLHPEVLHNISEILNYTHPPSLLAFARASKGCYAIASPLLHHTIKLTVTGDQELLSDANKWETILARDFGFTHVRRLIFFSDDEGSVFSDDSSPSSDDGSPQNPYLSLEPCERYDNDDTGFQNCWDLYSAQWFPHESNALIPAETWQCMARLVRKLTGLADMFWVCPIQIPPCVLKALHEGLQRCRLHHYSIRHASNTTRSMAEHDLAVATSPCLYEIGDLNGNDCHCPLEVVTRLRPPRLRKVHLWSRNDTIELKQADQNIPQPVPLELIQLDGSTFQRNMPFGVVDTLASGDFSALRVLKLNIPLALGGLPAPSMLPTMTTLSIHYNSKADASEEQKDEIVDFIRNLRRLTSLRVRDWDRAASIAPTLGPNLRILSLSTRNVPGDAALRDDHIQQLAELCPALEELTLEIKRSRGDAAEVARYRALGRLPRLQRLDLTLDASPPGYIPLADAETDDTTTRRQTAVEPWFDEQDAKLVYGNLRPHREGHIRDVFVNSAIDAALARSVFEVVDRAKPKGVPNVLRLERLELRASGGFAFPERGVMSMPSSSLRPYLTALNRRWLVERDVRDDARDVLHVRETNVNDRKYILPKHVNMVNKGQYLFGLWRRVWPVEHEGKDWWDDWQSFALELGDTIETYGITGENPVLQGAYSHNLGDLLKHFIPMVIWTLEVGIRGSAQEVTLPDIRQGITLSRNEYITVSPNGNTKPGVQLRVAIIEGGIVGVAAALDLMRRDLAVRLYEQATSFREIATGVAFKTNAREALQIPFTPTKAIKEAARKYLRTMYRAKGTWGIASM